jgi:hypothetical protein
MATKKEIKDTILNTAGNPESGVVVQYADLWAEAIVKLISGEAQSSADNNSQSGETKETRVVGAAERR